MCAHMAPRKPIEMDGKGRTNFKALVTSCNRLPHQTGCLWLIGPLHSNLCLIHCVCVCVWCLPGTVNSVVHHYWTCSELLNDKDSWFNAMSWYQYRENWRLQKNWSEITPTNPFTFSWFDVFAFVYWDNTVVRMFCGTILFAHAHLCLFRNWKVCLWETRALMEICWLAGHQHKLTHTCKHTHLQQTRRSQ